MATIRCTGKLEAQIGMKLPAIPDVSPFDWHANLLWLDGKKHILFCSDATRLSCLTPEVSKSQIRELPWLLKSALRSVMADERFAHGSIERVIAAQDPIALARTANRSVLGTINDNTMHIRFLRERSEGQSQIGLSELHHHLNHMPMKPNGWKHAIESFKQDFVDAVA